MALFKEPLIDYSIPDVHCTRGGLTDVPACVVVAQLSPHDYGLIVTKINEGGLSDNPPQVLSYALIGDGIDFDILGRSRTVVIYPGQQHSLAMRECLSLTFSDEGELWGLTFSLSQAKTTAINRFTDVVDKFQKVLATLPTMSASASKVVAPNAAYAAAAAAATTGPYAAADVTYAAAPYVAADITYAGAEAADAVYGAAKAAYAIYAADAAAATEA